MTVTAPGNPVDGNFFIVLNGVAEGEATVLLLLDQTTFPRVLIEH